MPMSDAQIGRNLARLRGTTSQRDLAEAMRARGWRWNQGTVSQVESGERPLRLAEAEDLARVLHQASGSVFAQGESEARFNSAFVLAVEAHRVLEVAVEQYIEAQVNLAVASDDSEVSAEDREIRADPVLREAPEDVVRRLRLGMQLGDVEDAGPLLRDVLERHERETSS